MDKWRGEWGGGGGGGRAGEGRVEGSPNFLLHTHTHTRTHIHTHKISTFILQDKKINTLCKSLEHTAERLYPALTQRATTVGNTFIKAFQLFAVCHNTYNGSVLLKDEEILKLGKIQITKTISILPVYPQRRISRTSWLITEAHIQLRLFWNTTCTITWLKRWHIPYRMDSWGHQWNKENIQWHSTPC